MDWNDQMLSVKQKYKLTHSLPWPRRKWRRRRRKTDTHTKMIIETNDLKKSSFCCSTTSSSSSSSSLLLRPIFFSSSTIFFIRSQSVFFKLHYEISSFSCLLFFHNNSNRVNSSVLLFVRVLCLYQCFVCKHIELTFVVQTPFSRAVGYFFISNSISFFVYHRTHCSGVNLHARLPPFNRIFTHFERNSPLPEVRRHCDFSISRVLNWTTEWWSLQLFEDHQENKKKWRSQFVQLKIAGSVQ